MAKDRRDLSRAYQNAAFIPHADLYPPRWEEEARNWRGIEHGVGRARLNLAYGSEERQVLDLFYPAGKPAGLAVFVHGGYWRQFDGKYWSHLSAGATARGWAVAVPSYRLAPDVRIGEITQDIAQAVGHAAGLVDGPIHLSGHSAGGHLVARMNCSDVGLEPGVADRIARILPISPLADLRPLLRTDINDDLQLTEAEAMAESPALCMRTRGIRTEIWVGAQERPAFVDQARWLNEAWEEADLHIAPGRHHFDVIDALADPASPLMKSLLD